MKAKNQPADSASTPAHLPAGQIDDFLAWAKGNGVQARSVSPDAVEVFACGGWVKFKREGHTFYGPAALRMIVGGFIHSRKEAGTAKPAHFDAEAWDEYVMECPLRLSDMSPELSMAARVEALVKATGLYADLMLAERQRRTRKRQAEGAAQ